MLLQIHIFLFFDIATRQTNKHSFVFQGHLTNVTGICYNGKNLFSSSEDKTWKRWDFGNQRSVLSVPTKSCLNSIAYLKEKDVIITANDRGHLEIWSPNDGELICEKKLSTAVARSIDIIEEKNIILVGMQDGIVVLVSFDGEQINEIRRIIAHEAILTKVKASPDSKYFATASADSTAKIFDVNTCECLVTLSDVEQIRWIWDISFTKDSKHVFTCGTDSTCRMWEVSTGQLLKSFTNHQKGVSNIILLE